MPNILHSFFNTATEAPRGKEDQITNEGSAPGWRPPQAPRESPQPQSPVFVDHMSKYGAGLDSQANYFSYFVVLAILCIVCYLVFHNKQKVRTGLEDYGNVRPLLRLCGTLIHFL